MNEAPSALHQRKLRHYYYWLRSAFLLWWAGFTDAICLHRCVVFFVHDHRILVKTGQCFALNGLVFLGSILLWTYALAPSIRWLLLRGMATWASPTSVEATYALLMAAFAALWLLPVYFISFLLSCVWYQEIAELAVRVVQQRPRKLPGGTVPAAQGGSVPPQLPAPKQQQQQQGSFMELAAQEVYRVVLFAVFFAQVYAVSFVPLVGKALNLVLLAWLNALYSFDYKWSLTARRLQSRVSFFQQHWAFFSGFGAVCALLTAYWSFFVGAALMAMAYPLFILIACDSEPRKAYQRVEAAEKAAGRQLHVGSLPIFALAVQATGWIIQQGPGLLKLPAALQQHRQSAVAVAGLGLVVGAGLLLTRWWQ